MPTMQHPLDAELTELQIEYEALLRSGGDLRDISASIEVVREEITRRDLEYKKHEAALAEDEELWEQGWLRPD